MLIAIEGCDGVGKTTLAESLVRKLNESGTWTGDEAELRHLGPPERHPLVECVHDFQTYRPHSGRHLVIDRLHVGELIYGPIYRNESKLGGIDGPGHRWVNHWLASVGALTVFVDAELETVLKRIDVRGDDYVQVEHLGQILSAYRDAQRSTYGSAHVGVRWPPPEGTTTSLVDRILVTADSLDRRAAHSPLAGARYLGVPDPRVVLVGDEPSPRHLENGGTRPDFRAPFVPYPDGSGWYLYAALTPSTLRGAAVINQTALTSDLARQLSRTRTCTGMGRSFIALGREADRRLNALNVPHATVPHPQYVRRFMHGHQADYGQLIARLGTDAVTGDFTHTLEESK